MFPLASRLKDLIFCLDLTYSYDPLKASLLANVILNTIKYLKEAF